MNKWNYLVRRAMERDRLILNRVVGMSGLTSEKSIQASNEFHEKWINSQQRGEINSVR